MQQRTGDGPAQWSRRGAGFRLGQHNQEAVSFLVPPAPSFHSCYQQVTTRGLGKLWVSPSLFAQSVAQRRTRMVSSARDGLACRAERRNDCGVDRDLLAGVNRQAVDHHLDATPVITGDAVQVHVTQEDISAHPPSCLPTNPGPHALHGRTALKQTTRPTACAAVVAVSVQSGAARATVTISGRDSQGQAESPLQQGAEALGRIRRFWTGGDHRQVPARTPSAPRLQPGLVSVAHGRQNGLGAKPCLPGYGSVKLPAVTPLPGLCMVGGLRPSTFPQLLPRRASGIPVLEQSISCSHQLLKARHACDLPSVKPLHQVASCFRVSRTQHRKRISPRGPVSAWRGPRSRSDTSPAETEGQKTKAEYPLRFGGIGR